MMTNFLKMCVNADIEDAIDFLKQMQGCVQDGDIRGAEHFADKVKEAFDLVQEGLFEAGFKGERRGEPV